MSDKKIVVAVVGGEDLVVRSTAAVVYVNIGRTGVAISRAEWLSIIEAVSHD